MTAIKPVVGGQYTLTFTSPAYDRHEKRYLPDNFRFVDPNFIKVTYGGCSPVDCSARCIVCNRKITGKAHAFLNMESFQECFISIHCLEHDSTMLWDPEVSSEKIEKWYSEEALKRDADAGDPLARFVIAIRDLEDEYE